MKVFVLNGSPKGEKSNTMRLTRAFIKGLQSETSCELTEFNLKKLNISACLGCFHCWTKTPGQCVLKDDMKMCLEAYLEADVVIWSFPLYYYGVPSHAKAFMDRLLPLNLPFIEQREDGSAVHPPRYDLSKKQFVCISTCGFFSRFQNYEALEKQFDILYDRNCLKIFCPEGELFSIEQLKRTTEEYLHWVKVAGKEFASCNKLTEETKRALETLLFPPKTFMEMANAHWIIQNESQNKDTSYAFMKQMNAIFNSKQAKDLHAIIEIQFTDLQKTYQLLIQNGTSTLEVGSKHPYTTKISTSFELWEKISKGKVSGTWAFLTKKYQVYGDKKVMLRFNKLYS